MEKKDYCPYCTGAEPLVVSKTTNDKGIAIKDVTGIGKCIYAYGFDIHGSGINGIARIINFCPICGKELIEERT